MANKKQDCGPKNWGFVKQGNLCVHQTVNDIKCSLGGPTQYNKQKQPIPACWDQATGQPNFTKVVSSRVQASATPTSEPTLSDACSKLMPFGDGSSSGSPKLVEDIKYLQERQATLLTKLKAVAAGGSASVSEDMLLKEIQVTQDTRMRLLKELSNIYTSAQCSLSSDRQALQDQMAMVELAEEQLQNVQTNINALINSRNNKHRMVQITNYEYDRYASHTSIFRIMAFCSLFILAGITLNSWGWTMLGNVVIVLAIVVLILTTIYRVWSNWWRDPMNWNQFEWYTRQKSPNYETVWEHDVKAFQKGYNQAKSESKYLYRKGSKQVDKAWGKVKKAGSIVEKGVSKTIGANTTHHKGNKKDKHENFAPYH